MLQTVIQLSLPSLTTSYSENFTERVLALRKEHKIVLKEELGLADLRIFERDYIPIKEGQTITGHLWIYRDVSTKIQAKRARQESEAQFRALFENAPLGMGVADFQGNLLLFNEAMLQPGGYSASDIWEIGNVKDLYYNPKQRQEVLKSLQKDGVLRDFPVQFKRKDGTPYDTLLSLTPIHFNNKPCLLAIVKDVTERKRVEEALRESQRRLATLMSNLPGMAYRCKNDPDWTMEFVSDGCQSITGYKPEELVGNARLSYAEIIHREDRRRVWEDVQKALEERKSFQLTYRITTASGEKKWVWEQGRGIFGQQGELIALEGFITDITDRIEAEQEIKNLAKFPSENPNPVLRIDRNGCLLYANEAAFSMLADWHLQVGDMVPVALQGLIQTAESGNKMVDIACGNRIFSVAVRSSQDADYINVYAIDITERKLMEDALRTSENFRRLIIENEPECVKVVGPDGSLIEMNPAGLKMIEADSLEKVKGKPVINLIAPEHRRAFKNLHRRAMHGKTGLLEFELVGLQGTRRWVESHAVPFRDENNQIVAVLSITRDITDRKRAEAALRESEARYRALFEQAIVPIYIFDPQTKRVLQANPAFFKILGLSPQELQNLHIYDFIGHDKASIDYYTELTLKEGCVDIGERIWRRKDGTEVYMNITVSCIEQGGKLLEFVVATDITERKLAQEALRESEERYRTLVEDSPMAVIVHSEGKIVYANPAAVKLIGAKSAPELLGKPVMEFVHPDYHQIVRERIRNIYEHKKAAPTLEEKFIRLDGQVIDVAVTGKTINFQRKPASQVIFQDITERLHMREQLKKKEQFLRKQNQIFMNLAKNKGLINGSFNDILTAITEAAAKTIGVERVNIWQFDNSRSKLCCLDHFTLSSGEHTQGIELSVTDYPTYFEALEKERAIVAHDALKDPKTKEFAESYLIPNGITSMLDAPIRVGGKTRGVICLEHTGAARRWSPEEENFAGSLADFVSLALENFERRQAEQALRESEEKYRHLIQHSGDAIYLLYNRCFELINEKFQEMFGLTLEDVNKPDFDFIHLVAPKSRPLVEERIKRLAAREKLEPKYEFTALNARGEEIEVEASVTYVKYKDGIATQGIIRDITERKRLEEQLRQAQKMEAVGKLAGGVAHDFNNILTVINGYCDLLLLSELSEKVRTSIEQIQKAGQRAARLTSQLLAFSRKQIINPKILNLNDLILDQNKLLERLLGEDIEIDLHLFPGFGKVKVDPGQMEQVIMNIVVNARDAMPFGGKLTIETAIVKFDADYIKTHAEAKAGDYVMLAISDTGVGMDEATCSRIFEPFFTTKGREKGTGLGLATVYGIVKQNQGFIYVYSEPHKGTTFKIYLPQVKETTKRTKATPLDQSELRGSETILLVEDDAAVREITCSTLRDYGYKLLTAENGKEALQIFQKKRGNIQLLLTDVIMPVMGGKELAEKLLKKNPNLKVLYFSGYTDNAIAHHGVLEDGVEFIQKPYTHTELARRIREILDKK